MLSVTLTVLKIIGIVLLCILGLVLLLVLLVLFCPIRYDIRAEVRQGEAVEEQPNHTEELSKRAEAQVAVNYLLHLVRGRLIYPAPEDGMLHIHVAFFRLYPRKRKTSGEEGTEEGTAEGIWEDMQKDPVEEAAENAPESPAEDIAEGSGYEWDPLMDEMPEEAEREIIEEPAPDEAEEKPTEDTGENMDGKSDESSADTAADQEKPPKKTLSERIDAVRERIAAFAEKPQVAAEKIYYTTSGIYDKINKVRVTLDSAIFARAKQLLFNEARRVVKHVLPRKCRVSLVYGADDPAKTADIIAKTSMLYPIFEERVQVVPDFEGETLYGTARIKGRVRLAVLAYSFLRLYFNRDVKKTVRRFKKIKEGGVSGGREKDK